MKAKLILAAILLTAAPAFAASGDMDPASAKQLHDYVLSLPKVTAFETSYEALQAAAKSDPSLKADFQAARSEHTKTMADEVAKMTHHPKVYAFFAKQGLSKEDAAILPLALMGGCMVAQYPQAAAGLAAQTSAQQAQFCKANKAAIDKLKFVSG